MQADVTFVTFCYMSAITERSVSHLTTAGSVAAAVAAAFAAGDETMADLNEGMAQVCRDTAPPIQHTHTYVIHTASHREGEGGDKV